MSPMQRPFRILLVDDDAGVRAAGRRLLRAQWPTAIIGEAANGDELLVAVDEAAWDVLVLDIRMPGRSGLELLAELRTLRPQLPVVMWSALRAEPYRAAALAGGAVAFVDKQHAADELIDAIERFAGRDDGAAA